MQDQHILRVTSLSNVNTHVLNKGSIYIKGH